MTKTRSVSSCTKLRALICHSREKLCSLQKQILHKQSLSHLMESNWEFFLTRRPTATFTCSSWGRARIQKQNLWIYLTKLRKMRARSSTRKSNLTTGLNSNGVWIHNWLLFTMNQRCQFLGFQTLPSRLQEQLRTRRSSKRFMDSRFPQKAPHVIVMLQLSFLTNLSVSQILKI